MDSEARIQRSIEYIERNLRQDIGLEEIAKQSHFSEFHFHRLFRKAVGASVMDYVRKRRLAEAASDISETDERITDIAFRYQFNSEESFSRAFKRLHGVSPREYRKSQRAAVVERVRRESRTPGTLPSNHVQPRMAA